MSSSIYNQSANQRDGRRLVSGRADAVKVALFSTDQILIASLTQALSDDGRFALKVTSFNTAGMGTWLLAYPADLAIVDLEPPTGTVLRVMSLITNLRPTTQMMALMSRRSLDSATVAVQAGAQSCLLKETCGSQDVIAALNGLVAGANAISPRIARVLINRFRQLH